MAHATGIANLDRKYAAMKVTVEIDCTPAEARQFFGLPDVEPLQRKVMEEVERRTMAELERFSPDNLLKTWLTLAPGSAAQMQEAFGKLFQPGFGLGPDTGKRDAAKRDTKK